MMAIHTRMAAAEKALPGYAEFTARRAALREDINRTDKSTKAARAAITQSFPDFLALSDPRPLPVATVQALLQGDEALVAILVGSNKSFVWAVTREGAEWAQIDAGAAALAEHVTALRRGLDPQAQRDAEGSAGSRPGIVQGFDLNRAHALYKLVLGPVAPVLAGKRHLIVVPTGSLTSLPFQVLLTAPPGKESGADAFRNAAWLIKSHALSVLPSVQLLEALRKLAPSEKATQPFMGIGDPVLKGPLGATRAARRGEHGAGALLPQRSRQHPRPAAAGAAARDRRRAADHRQDPRRAAERHHPARGGLGEARQGSRAHRVPRHPVRHAWAGGRRPLGPLRAGARADAAGGPRPRPTTAC